MVRQYDRRRFERYGQPRRQGLLHRACGFAASGRRVGRQNRSDRLFTTMTIKFGTDGWRAIIADTFTFENVRIVAQASADYFQTVEGRERGVFIGYDVRFLSSKFASIAA